MIMLSKMNMKVNKVNIEMKMKVNKVNIEMKMKVNKVNVEMKMKVNMKSKILKWKLMIQDVHYFNYQILLKPVKFGNILQKILTLNKIKNLPVINVVLFIHVLEVVPRI